MSRDNPPAGAVPQGPPTQEVPGRLQPAQTSSGRVSEGRGGPTEERELCTSAGEEEKVQTTRERGRRRVMMSSTTHVLNVSADRSGARRPPAELSLELQKTMLRLKGEFMSEDGREVRYSQLRSSEVFREYELLAGALCHCDLTDIVEDEDEMKAFFISILIPYLFLF